MAARDGGIEAVDQHLAGQCGLQRRRGVPKEIGVVLVVDLQQSTVGGHQFRGSKAACGRAVLAHQPSDAAAERVARDPNRPGKAVERRESVRMRGGDDIAPLRACFRSRRAGRPDRPDESDAAAPGVMCTRVMLAKFTSSASFAGCGCPCPPPCTAIDRLCSRAKLTADATSAEIDGITTMAGR